MRGLVVAIAMLASTATPPSLGHAAAPTDQDIVDSYQYMLSRWLVLRQESLDLEEGFKWNENHSPQAGRRDMGQPKSRCCLQRGLDRS